MYKFKIEYNPFFNTTSVWNDNEKMDGHKINQFKTRRMIDIVDTIPEFLYEEANEDYNIEFIGRLFEFEDLSYACHIYSQKNKIDIKLKHTSKYENIDITQLSSFEQLLRESPIDKISKNEKLIQSFLEKLTTDFEVAVVATMSSGKSTLINSIIGQSILPADHEATTAKIFSIRDDDDLQEFSLELFDKKDHEIKPEGDSLSAQLENANKQEEVYKIQLHGDIPSISSSTANLVLLDTPGPNNAQNQEHKEITYKLIKDDEKNPLILYVLNVQALTADDVSSLLREIAETIKGRNTSQNHDRFLFVLNKSDELNEDKIDKMIKDAKGFLEDFGINKPKLFPISSYRALCCRKKIGGYALNDHEDDALDTCKKVVEKEREYHYLEQYAPLSDKQNEVIQNRLQKAKEEDDWLMQAEIHSGIPSLELAIDSYVNKYAIPMKIHDAFYEIEKAVNLEEAKNVLLNELQSSKRKDKEIGEKLQKASKKLNSKKTINDFKKKIGKIELDSELIDNEIEKLEKQFNEILDNEIFQKNLEDGRVKGELNNIYKATEDLQINIKTTLEKHINENIKTQIDRIGKEFKKEVSKIFEDLELGSITYEIQSVANFMIPDKKQILEEALETKTYTRTFFWFFSWDVKYTESNPEKLRERFLAIQQEFKKKIHEQQTKTEDMLKDIKTNANKELETVRNEMAKVMQEFSNLSQHKEQLQNQIIIRQDTIDWINEYNRYKNRFVS